MDRAKQPAGICDVRFDLEPLHPGRLVADNDAALPPVGAIVEGTPSRSGWSGVSDSSIVDDDNVAGMCW